MTAKHPLDVFLPEINSWFMVCLKTSRFMFWLIIGLRAAQERSLVPIDVMQQQKSQNELKIQLWTGTRKPKL